MKEKMKNRFDWLAPEAVTEADGREVFTVPAERLPEAAAFLKESGYDFLVDMVGMDYGDRLGVVNYVARSENTADVVVLRSAVADRERPVMPSLGGVWEVARMYEREVHDYFGIRFAGNDDMRRLFLRASWNGYPLRKDYDASPEANPVPLENESLFDMDTVPVVETGPDGAEHTVLRPLYREEEYVINFGPQHPACTACCTCGWRSTARWCGRWTPISDTSTAGWRSCARDTPIRRYST